VISYDIHYHFGCLSRFKDEVMMIFHRMPVLLLSTLCLIFPFSVALADTPNNAIGEVVWVKGLVQALQGNGSKRPLQRSSSVYTSDTVETDQTSTGQITFTDNTLLSLRPNTIIRLAEYKHGNGVPPQSDTFIVNVVKGGFRTVTGIISKNHPTGYQIQTPMGTIGVQGTVYDVLYSVTAQKLTVAVDSGKITITPIKGPPIVLTQGSQNIAAIVTAGQTRVLSVKPPEVRAVLPVKATATSITPSGTPGKNVIKVAPCP